MAIKTLIDAVVLEPEAGGFCVKILVVDDHPLVREGLRHVLIQLCEPLAFLEAANAREALIAASEHSDIDLALLDLNLPDMDGFRALAALREGFPAVPVVVLSAYNDRETVLKAIDAGAMGFIGKSSGSQVMVNALRLVLSGGVYLPPEALTHPEAQVTPWDGKTGVSAADLGLTDRQREVLALLVHGKANKLICRELGLAEGTVKIHVSAILRALNVTNRTQAVLAVARLGLKLP
jgi:DNA-binding NarL/FixJ family response regulator